MSQYGDQTLKLNPKEPNLNEGTGKKNPPSSPPPPKKDEVKITSPRRPPPPKPVQNTNQTLQDFSSKVKLEGLTSLKSDSYKADVTKISRKLDSLKGDKNSADNLEKETDILEQAQAELEKIDTQTTEEQEKGSKRERVLVKLRNLGIEDADGLRNKIDENNKEKAERINKEIELLEELRDTEGLKGTDTDGKEVSNANVKIKIDKKLKEKYEEKEKTRKKHWWERVFFHKDDTKDNYNTIHSEKTTGFWKNIKTDLSSTKSSLFVSYCLFSIIVFTLTMMTFYGNSSIRSQNQKLMNSVEGLYYLGLGIIGIFLASLAISFGQDKDIEQKVGSFIILLGGIYMGGFFTYLDATNSFVASKGSPPASINDEENFLIKVSIGLYIIFILASIYYVLFDKREGKYSRIFSILYCVCIVLGFLIVGGGFTHVSTNLKTISGQKENSLIPIGLFLYIFGLLLLILCILNSIPFVNNAIEAGIDTALGLLEPLRIKIMITLMFIMTIYYSVSFFKVYYSKYVKGAGKEDEGLNPYLRISFLIGFTLLGLLVLSLSLSFGGDLKEKVVSFILVLFIIFTGGLLTYLDNENQIQTSGEITTMVSGTVIVYVVLLIACLIYTLFKKKTGDEALVEDIIRVLSNFGGIILFFYMFGICTAVAFDEFLFHNPGSPEGISLWIGFAVGLLLIIGTIYLMFF